MNIKITKAPVGGCVRVPGSKSMAQRLILAWALSKTECCVTAHSGADDVLNMGECAKEIFAAIEEKKTSIPEPLKVGESGAVLRFVMPVLGALGISADLKMEGRLPERPMDPLISQLRQHGVTVERAADDTYHVEGQLNGGIFELPGDQSSQFISGLLMALPLIGENSELRIFGDIQSRPYVDMTLDVLAKSGITIIEDGPGDFYIQGNQEYRLEGEYEAEGDWSGAAFWLALGATMKEGLTVAGLNSESLHGDREIISILKRMGADINVSDAGITVRGGKLYSSITDCRNIPDLVSAIAIAACAADGKTIITNAERLRLKESDRMRAITDVLRAFGVLVDERADGLEIFGGGGFHGGTVSSHGDHRIAMMAACMRGLTPEGPAGDIIIYDAETVNKSYPGFFEDYRALGGDWEEI